MERRKLRDLAVGTVIIALALPATLIAAYLSWATLTDWFEERQAREERAGERLRKQIVLGDDTVTVKLQLGLPDERATVPPDIAWGFQSVDSTNWSTVAHFDARKEDGALILARVTMVPGYEAWTPRDELTVSRFESSDDALERFETFYGKPCDVEVADTTVEYSFKVRQNDDNLKGLRRLGDSLSAVRYLRMRLRNGKEVSTHGWSAIETSRAGECRD